MNPGTPSLLRGINDRAALDLLLEHGPLSRSQLGELTGLSKPTASQLLSPAGRRRAGRSPAATPGAVRGRSAQLYAVNPDAAHVAALDVTPDPDPGRGRRRHRPDRRGVRAADPAPAQGPTRWSQVLQAVDGAAASAGIRRDRLHRLAIGTPGAFDPVNRQLRYARTCPAGTTRTCSTELAGSSADPRRGRQRRQPRRDRRDQRGTRPGAARTSSCSGRTRASARPS